MVGKGTVPMKATWQSWLGTFLMLLMASTGWIYSAGVRRGTSESEFEELKESHAKLQTDFGAELKQLREAQLAQMTLLQVISTKQDVMAAEQRLLHHDQLFRLPLPPARAVGSLDPGR